MKTLFGTKFECFVDKNQIKTFTNKNELLIHINIFCDFLFVIRHLKGDMNVITLKKKKIMCKITSLTIS